MRSQESFTFVKPRAAEDPLRKCPRLDSSGKFLAPLTVGQKSFRRIFLSQGREIVQRILNLSERRLGLFKVIPDYRLAKLSFVIVVHLQELIEDRMIDEVV